MARNNFHHFHVTPIFLYAHYAPTPIILSSFSYHQFYSIVGFAPTPIILLLFSYHLFSLIPDLLSGLSELK
jgi:hypothetical protein